MIIEDDLIKKLLEVRDSEDVVDSLPRFKKNRIKERVEEKVDVGAWDSVGVHQRDVGFEITLSISGTNDEKFIAQSDNEQEAVETARKLASALDINFKGLVESTEDPLKAKKPKELSKEGEKDGKLQHLKDKIQEGVLEDIIIPFLKNNNFTLLHLEKLKDNEFHDLAMALNDNDQNTVKKYVNIIKDRNKGAWHGLGSNESINEQDEEEQLSEVEPEEEPEISRPEDNEPEVPEITKEYIGNTEDDNYYLISTESDDGIIEDLQIVDQEGVEKFSAKANSIPVENVGEFLAKGIIELKIQNIEFGIAERYLFPLILEEDNEVEEEDSTTEEELEEQPEEKEEPVERKKVKEKFNAKELRKDTLVRKAWETLGFDIDKASDEEVEKSVESVWTQVKDSIWNLLKKDNQKESKSKNLLEMKITDHENNVFNVSLVDDGTMDTVLDINGKEFRFDSEFASLWRDEEGNLSTEGIEQLALDALSGMEEDEYNKLLVSGEEMSPPEEEAMDNESKVKEGYDNPGVRDGSGPPEGVGRRQAAGEPCPCKDNPTSYTAYEELEQHLFSKFKEENPEADEEEIWQMIHSHMDEMGMKEPGETSEKTEVEESIEDKGDQVTKSLLEMLK